MTQETLDFIMRTWFLYGSILYFGWLGWMTYRKRSEDNDGVLMALWLLSIEGGWPAFMFLPYAVILALSDLGFLEMPI